MYTFTAELGEVLACGSRDVCHFVLLYWHYCLHKLRPWLALQAIYRSVLINWGGLHLPTFPLPTDLWDSFNGLSSHWLLGVTVGVVVFVLLRIMILLDNLEVDSMKYVLIKEGDLLNMTWVGQRTVPCVKYAGKPLIRIVGHSFFYFKNYQIICECDAIQCRWYRSGSCQLDTYLKFHYNLHF